MTEPSPTCTFAELVPLCQELFDPVPAHLIALIARMKNAQHVARMSGSPTPGRGKAAKFDQEQLRQLLVIMELGRLGIAPQKASELYDEHKARFFGECGVATITFDGRASCIQIDMGPIRDAARRHLPQFFYPLAERRSDRLARRMGGAFVTPEHTNGCRHWANEECDCK